MKETSWRDEFTKLWYSDHEVEEMDDFISSLLEQAKAEEVKSCPPHNLIDFAYTEPWAASVPPPNKKCTKCLLEVRF